MGSAMQILSDIAPTSRREEWVLLDDVAAAKRLTASDLVRMALAKPRLLPRTCELHGRVWAHEPTLVDWEALLLAVGFKTEAQLQSAILEASDASQ